MVKLVIWDDIAPIVTLKKEEIFKLWISPAKVNKESHRYIKYQVKYWQYIVHREISIKNKIVSIKQHWIYASIFHNVSNNMSILWSTKSNRYIHNVSLYSRWIGWLDIARNPALKIGACHSVLFIVLRNIIYIDAYHIAWYHCNKQSPTELCIFYPFLLIKTLYHISN